MGILPTVKDRIIQSAMKIVIELIFDADFKDCSYEFRPKRNQHQALKEIRKTCNNKGNYVLDGDIKEYFDNINHEELMILVEKRISDKKICKLIKKWLKLGVMIEGRVETSELGSPQGGVISLLLANIYLDYLDTVWERYYSHLGKLICFVDDFVIVCKNYKDVNSTFLAIWLIMSRLELNLNLDKTRIVNLWGGKEGFIFLGSEIRKVKMNRVNGTQYYATEQRICKKAKQNIQAKVKEALKDSTLYQDLEVMIKRLNLKIVGWRNYYGISLIRILFKIDKFILARLALWYNRKRQNRKRYEYYELAKMFKDLGLKRVAFES